MSEVKDGGPAFPIRERTEHLDGEIICNEWPGLTKRELYAVAVLQGLFSIEGSHHLEYKANAKIAFAQADAMIQESEAKP